MSSTSKKRIIRVYPDFRQTPEYSRFLNSCGWLTANVSHLFDGNSTNYGFLWRVPFVDRYFLTLPKVDKSLNIQKLNTFCRSKKVAFCRFEINKAIDSRKNIYSGSINTTNWNSTPSCTRVIDLSLPLAKITSDMSHKVRYNSKIATKRGVRVEFVKASNINFFEIVKIYKLLDFGMGNKAPHLSLQKFFKLVYNCKQNIVLALATFDKTTIAVSLFICSPKVVSYGYNTSRKIGRTFFAPTLLIFEAIKYFKKLGFKHLDLEGSFDYRNDITNSWQGFTRFKKGFGGSLVYLPLPGQITYFKPKNILEKVEGRWMHYYFKLVRLNSIYPTTMHVTFPSRKWQLMLLDQVVSLLKPHKTT